MFRRVLYENWHQLVPIVAFVLTFGVFLIAIVRAFMTGNHESERLASLPLDDGTPHTEPEPAPQTTRKPCDGTCADCRCLRRD
jgi:hypothetical protein